MASNHLPSCDKQLDKLVQPNYQSSVITSLGKSGKSLSNAYHFDLTDEFNFHINKQ